MTCDPNELTPVVWDGSLNCWTKRDDAFQIGPACGGKARAILLLAQANKPLRGLVAACGAISTVMIAAGAVARHVGVPCRMYVPARATPTPEMSVARALGVGFEDIRPGYPAVVEARARAFAQKSRWLLLPFGLESETAVAATAAQVENLPWGKFSRIVIVAGSGVNLAGVLRGLEHRECFGKVLAVVVGRDPRQLVKRWAPEWHVDYKFALLGYGTAVAEPGGFDPYYEAKALPFLEEGDLLWVVGRRPSPLRRIAKYL